MKKKMNLSYPRWIEESKEFIDYMFNSRTSKGRFLISYSLRRKISSNIGARAKDSSQGSPSNISKGDTAPSRVLEDHGIVGCVRVKIDAFP